MDNGDVPDGSAAPGGGGGGSGGSGAPWSTDDTGGGGNDSLDGFNSREIGGGSKSLLTKINMNC